MKPHCARAPHFHHPRSVAGCLAGVKGAMMSAGRQLSLRGCSVSSPVGFPALIVPHTKEANLETKRSMSKPVHHFYVTLALKA